MATAKEAGARALRFARLNTVTENTTANPIPLGRVLEAYVQYLIPCYFSPAKLTQQALLQEAERGYDLCAVCIPFSQLVSIASPWLRMRTSSRQHAHLSRHNSSSHRDC